MKTNSRTNEINKMTSPQQGQASTYREHNCWSVYEYYYLLGPEGSAKMCGCCEKILEFRYRSFWKRLLRVFKDF